MSAEAIALLAEIMAYCDRTGTPPGWVGKLAFNHPGFVPLLRKRKLLTEKSAAAVRAVMAFYPAGIPEADLDRRRLIECRSPKERSQIQAALARMAFKAAAEARPRVERDPCPRCEVRGDIGCKHSRARMGTSF